MDRDLNWLLAIGASKRYTDLSTTSGLTDIITTEVGNEVVMRCTKTDGTVVDLAMNGLLTVAQKAWVQANYDKLLLNNTTQELEYNGVTVTNIFVGKKADFPTTGADNKLYIDTTNADETIYRWTGTGYKAISSGGTSDKYNGTNVKLNVDNLKKVSGNLDNFTFVDFMELLTNKPTTVTLTCTLPTLVYEKGTTINNGTTLKATVAKGSKSISKVEFYKNDILVNTITTGVANGGNFTHADGNPISSDTTYKVMVTDEGNNKVSAILKVQFYHPFYHGICNESVTELTQTVIKGMTKDVSAKDEKVYSYTANNQYVVIAYPKEYGQLTSILDPSSFQNLDSFSKAEIEIDSVPYYVYQSATKVVCTNFAYTFIF